MAAASGSDHQASLDDHVTSALARVRSRLADLGQGRPIAVIAVTKGFGPEAVRAAVAAGADGCGENYAQELVDKARELDPLQPRWHFIGQLQRNKVRHLAPLVSVWQSVDRLALGAEIARRAPGATVMVQCNLSGEEHKGGCTFAEVPGLASALTDLGLRVSGLMGVAAAGPPESARPSFERLVEVADELGLPERSIGMSGDYEVAVEAGATVVRLGTVLFGQRSSVGAPRTGDDELPEQPDSVGQ